jgi:hypothetical protein
MSLFSASIVIALCRRKSTRLVAVIGGLVIALGILFASFATMVHQVALSYCEYLMLIVGGCWSPRALMELEFHVGEFVRFVTCGKFLTCV